MKHDIFVSYRRADRELVAAVVRRLEERGVGVWYDAEIEGGADWREVIVEALTNSDMLAIFFSDDCNNSRQLKKELAVADTLGKPVVPILIENTQPRGAYLYELADRNWIQMWPEPMERIEELVEHLTVLAGKSDGGLAGARLSKSLAPAAANEETPEAANDAEAAPGAPAEAVMETEQALDEAVEDFIAGADQPVRAAPKMAKAYVGRVSQPGKAVRKLNDIPPFRWIDLVFLVPAWIGIFAWSVASNAGSSAGLLDAIMAQIAVLCLIAAGLYGAVVFPIRYFLRRRPVLDALWKYLVSELMIFVAAFGVVLNGVDRNRFEVDFAEFFLVSGLIGGAFVLIAFAVYGVLAGQRAIRSFKSNLRKL